VKFSEVCIERPVLATVISLLITMLGAIALFRLPNRELPDVDPPIVSVITVYPGAAPEVVETSVTEPLEDQLIGIEGVKHLTSLSREQVSGITVEFDLSRDVISLPPTCATAWRARNELPDDVDEPSSRSRTPTQRCCGSRSRVAATRWPSRASPRMRCRIVSPNCRAWRAW
jgi:multidrug efflux pump subunit AcrB